MSKSNISTRQKILDKALEMFNERGIEYVGLRELATMLDIRVGNITYYFPTKDDLVYELSLELGKQNSLIIVTSSDMSISRFMSIQYQVFKNHQKFRCLLLSFVHVMKQNKLIAAAYTKRQKIRRDTIKANISVMAASGYLKLESEAENDFLVSAIALISRFWISEAAISGTKMNEEQQIRYYLTLLSGLIMPYTTARGKKDLQQFAGSL